jgi:choline dehydrogenase-like flavoprotein
MSDSVEDRDGSGPDPADVIVVGGRCAGAPVAMLLARAGLRVRLLERARQLGDVVSGHMIKSPGTARLREWGLLGELLGVPTPAITERTLWVDGEPHPAPPLPAAQAALAPRRSVLDRLLLAAARDAGADVRLGVAVRGVLRRGRARDRRPDQLRRPQGAAGHRRRRAPFRGRPGGRCRLHLAAAARDLRVLHLLGGRGGRRHSRLARTRPVHGPVSHQRPPGTHVLPGPRRRVRRRAARPRRALPARPARPSAAAPAPAGWGDHRAHPWHRRPAELLPAFGRARVGPRGRCRAPQGPAIARGIADAFRDAAVLAETVTRHWDDELDAALTAYERLRDRDARPLAEINLTIAALDQPGPVLAEHWRTAAALEQQLAS